MIDWSPNVCPPHQLEPDAECAHARSPGAVLKRSRAAGPDGHRIRLPSAWSIRRGKSRAPWPTSALCPMSLRQRLARGAPGGGRTIMRSAGIAIDPERLILTVSTSEAYSYCFRLLCEPGDEVLVPSPSYPLFEFLADIQDVRIVPFELVYDEGWQIEFESLSAAASARAHGRCSWCIRTIRPAHMSSGGNSNGSTSSAANTGWR